MAYNVLTETHSGSATKITVAITFPYTLIETMSNIYHCKLVIFQLIVSIHFAYFNLCV